MEETTPENPLAHLLRVASALFLTDSIFSLSPRRAKMVSTFFLTLIPTSFPLGSTYSKSESDFKKYRTHKNEKFGV